jgi:hypothetical protein
MASMSRKPKVQVAREHLTKARDEAASGDLEDAIQWGFAGLETAIDALAERRNIDIDQKHWRRAEAAQQFTRMACFRRTSLGFMRPSTRRARESLLSR